MNVKQKAGTKCFPHFIIGAMKFNNDTTGTRLELSKYITDEQFTGSSWKPATSHTTVI
jgi:hypothetical protein